MNINHLISIGLYISGIVVFAIYMCHDFKNILDTDVKEECNNMMLPEELWPIIVFLMTIVYLILCCVWPIWIVQDLWKSMKAAFKKT